MGHQHKGGQVLFSAEVRELIARESRVPFLEGLNEFAGVKLLLNLTYSYSPH
jgi:hypothetical protein